MTTIPGCVDNLRVNDRAFVAGLAQAQRALQAMTDEQLLTLACEKLESCIGWPPSPWLGPEVSDKNDRSREWPLELHDWWEGRRPSEVERARRLLKDRGFSEAAIREALPALREPLERQPALSLVSE